MVRQRNRWIHWAWIRFIGFIELVGEKRCVTTLITAAEEATFTHSTHSFTCNLYFTRNLYLTLNLYLLLPSVCVLPGPQSAFHPEPAVPFPSVPVRLVSQNGARSLSIRPSYILQNRREFNLRSGVPSENKRRDPWSQVSVNSVWRTEVKARRARGARRARVEDHVKKPHYACSAALAWRGVSADLLFRNALCKRHGILKYIYRLIMHLSMGLLQDGNSATQGNYNSGSSHGSGFWHLQWSPVVRPE